MSDTQKPDLVSAACFKGAHDECESQCFCDCHMRLVEGGVYFITDGRGNWGARMVGGGGAGGSGRTVSGTIPRPDPAEPGAGGRG